jgi:23S rRNA (guanosine2251-2'-O)-methyltransferase
MRTGSSIKSEIRNPKSKEPYLIPGYHGVREALLQNQLRISKLWISRTKRSARAQEILQMARERRIPVYLKEGEELARVLPDTAHQGIVAFAEEFTYPELDRLIEIALQNKDRALLIASDHITDAGNLGAVIRTASYFGVHGLMIPKDRSAKVTPKMLKRSSGAYLHLPIAKVVNMARSLRILDEKGFWIIGASGESPVSIYELDWKRDLVLVLGSEQRGLSHGVRKRCHQVVSVPGMGKVESLNVGVACGVILSEIVRQRNL